MPSHDPQSQNDSRPSPKTRAAALKAAAARTLQAAATAIAQDAPDQPKPSPAEALVAQIGEAWRLYAQAERDGLSDDATVRIDVRRSVLLDDAEALPATSENVPAKALALAWITFAHLWHAGWSRDDYATDGRLALDIKAAIAGAELAAPMTSEQEDLPDPRCLASAFDVGTLRLRDLAALHGVARTISGVADGLVCQPRCSRDGNGTGLSPAGRLADWIGAVTSQVVEAVREETLQRPSDSRDDDDRLTVLAEYVVWNGEPEQMRAFARDLEAEAARMDSRSASHG